MVSTNSAKSAAKPGTAGLTHRGFRVTIAALIVVVLVFCEAIYPAATHAASAPAVRLVGAAIAGLALLLAGLGYVLNRERLPKLESLRSLEGVQRLSGVDLSQVVERALGERDWKRVPAKGAPAHTIVMQSQGDHENHVVQTIAGAATLSLDDIRNREGPLSGMGRPALITAGSFAPDAIVYARQVGIDLVDGTGVLELVSELRGESRSMGLLPAPQMKWEQTGIGRANQLASRSTLGRPGDPQGTPTPTVPPGRAPAWSQPAAPPPTPVPLPGGDFEVMPRTAAGAGFAGPGQRQATPPPPARAPEPERPAPPASPPAPAVTARAPSVAPAPQAPSRAQAPPAPPAGRPAPAPPAPAGDVPSWAERLKTGKPAPTLAETGHADLDLPDVQVDFLWNALAEVADEETPAAAPPPPAAPPRPVPRPARPGQPVAGSPAPAPARPAAAAQPATTPPGIPLGAPGPGAAPSPQQPRPLPPPAQPGPGRAMPPAGQVPAPGQSATAPRCPECGSPMRPQVVGGRRFWACTRFPECGGMRPVP